MEQPYIEKAMEEGFFPSYDDVLIKPRYSNLKPWEPELRGRFSKNVEMELPISSAAMDRVTEEEMARRMALRGGIGVIHRNMTPERQAEMVAKVKRSGYMIQDPVTVTPKMKVSEVYEISERLGFQTFPVVKEERVVGIVTGRDLRLAKLMELLGGEEKRVEDIMSREVVYVEPDASVEEALKKMHESGIEKLLVLEEGKLYGLITLRDLEEIMTNPKATRDRKGRLKVGAAVGVFPHERKRVELLYKSEVDVIVIDSSHGYSQDIIRTLKEIKREYGDAFDVVAGNVATGEGAVALAQAGADAVKVGIGPGAACITREVTGVGVPQLSAVYLASRALEKEGYDVPVIADGGIKNSGDIAKAFAAGADSVMIGSLLAGTDASPGRMVIINGVAYKDYRGMASKAVLGTRAGYGRVPEGVEGFVPYRGKLEKVLDELEGGVKSAFAHVGARNMAEFREKAQLIRVSRIREGIKLYGVRDSV